MILEIQNLDGDKHGVDKHSHNKIEQQDDLISDRSQIDSILRKRLKKMP